MRLIDADALEQDVYHIGYKPIIEWKDVQKQSTIDAVPVVRCKNCEYFSEPNSFSGKCTLRGDYIFTNDFCSYAVERRIDE